MRIARVLLLAALAALAAMALTATAANATNTPVHVEEENEEALGGANCNDLLDNCILHAESIGPESGGTETELIAGTTVVSRCHDEFEAEIFNEAGDGHIYDQILTNGPSNQCTITPCVGVEAEWPFTMHEEGGEFWLQFRFCLRNALGQQVHCDLEPEIRDESTHHWFLHSPTLPCTNPEAAGLFVNGQWEIENHPHEVAEHDDIEITHDP